VLDLNIGTKVIALEGVERRQPVSRVLIALGLVQIISHGNELGPGKVVCESFALGIGPVTSTTNPCLFQGNNVINIQIGWKGCCNVVVGRHPLPGCGVTVSANYDTSAISFKDSFSGIAIAADCTGISERPYRWREPIVSQVLNRSLSYAGEFEVASTVKADR